YPELQHIKRINTSNSIYPLVRSLLERLGLDSARAGTSSWNPFRDFIRPGDRVLIKPNLVTHQHYLGENALLSTVVHGSVLRPLVDYVCLAQQGRGSVIIADNPIENADFEKIMEITGIRSMVEALQRDGLENIRVLDLRPRVMVEDKKGRFFSRSQPGDPLGYAAVNLGKESLFAEFDPIPDLHFYTLSDPEIDHFDPCCIRPSSTDSYHNSSTHTYLISRSVLEADVIIDVGKMKTHCKAGASLSLKNMVGIVYEKMCMPHHRPGTPPFGDSFPQPPSPHYVFSRKSYRDLRRLVKIHRFPGFRALRNFLHRKKVLVGQHIEHGNWKGNDTIWRTILDLNRIALYADREGRMQKRLQRKIFAFIDGIIAQEGEGPMNGEPLASSIVFAGFNPVKVDALALKAMGIEPDLVKSVAMAGTLKKWKIYQGKNPADIFPANNLPCFNFKLPGGWK
ncbi:MAG: DUF362 domain-containing protein, partial [Candidatus Aminicenantales bacterium]